MRLNERGDQIDRCGRFELRPHGSSGDVDLLRDGVPAYRIEDRPRTLADFDAACEYQRTSRDSVFTRILICSLPLPGGRVTLYGQLLIRTVAGERTEEHLSESDTLIAYKEIFGIELDRLPYLPTNRTLPINRTRPGEPVRTART